MSEANTAGVPGFTGSCSEIYSENAFDNTGWRPKWGCSSHITAADRVTLQL